MNAFTKKEYSIITCLREELKKINKFYEIKNETLRHYGIRHYIDTTYTIFYKDYPVLYIAYVYEHFYRKYIKLREVCDMNRNVYILSEDDNINNELALILSALDLSVLDNALLDEFIYEDYLDENVMQLSLYIQPKISRKIKKLNRKFNSIIEA